MSEARVLKWTVEIDDNRHTIGGGQVLHVASQYGSAMSVQVWTLEVGDDAERVVKAFGTGWPLPSDLGPHVGSAVASNGAFVWHVFEVQP